MLQAVKAVKRGLCVDSDPILGWVLSLSRPHLETCHGALGGYDPNQMPDESNRGGSLWESWREVMGSYVHSALDQEDDASVAFKKVGVFGIP